MNGRIRMIWFITGILFTAAAVLACFYAGLFGSIINTPQGDPQETVTAFFENVTAGNYEEAYTRLGNYSSLGLENEPETGEGKLIYDAVRSNFTWNLKGDCAINGYSATQKVKVRTLNIKRIESEIADRVDGIMEKVAAERTAAELYDAEGKYLTSLTDEVYLTALHQVLADADIYCVERELELQLENNGEQWLINADKALMNALAGGEA